MAAPTRIECLVVAVGNTRVRADACQTLRDSTSVDGQFPVKTLLLGDVSCAVGGKPVSEASVLDQLRLVGGVDRDEMTNAWALVATDIATVRAARTAGLLTILLVADSHADEQGADTNASREDAWWESALLARPGYFATTLSEVAQFVRDNNFAAAAAMAKTRPSKLPSSSSSSACEQEGTIGAENGVSHFQIEVEQKFVLRAKQAKRNLITWLRSCFASDDSTRNNDCLLYTSPSPRDRG